MHWSVGLMGYFATYTIGNLMSVQRWETFRATNPAADDHSRQGDTPRELVQRVTGSGVDPAPYLEYLDDKYRDVCSL